jgi:hypothetical protein
MLRRHRYLILLLALLLVIVVGMSRGPFPYLREGLVSLTMVLVFLIVFDRRLMRLASLVAGLIVVAAMWTMRLAPGATTREIAIVLHFGLMLFLALAVAMVLRHLFERRAVGIDDILGTMCGYLLAALAWANLYGMIEVLMPGAFAVDGLDKPELLEWFRRESLFVYFSLTTLTTIGYGDVTPVAPSARSAAMLEGVFGQFYIAVVVAQLVGSKLAESTTHGGSDGR